MPYHTPTYKVLEELSVDPNVGVCPDEIEDRRRQFGANVFETQQKSSITQLFFEQIKDHHSALRGIGVAAAAGSDRFLHHCARDRIECLDRRCAAVSKRTGPGGSQTAFFA